ncbi:extracellular solute-binding protein [Pseudonocardia sp.]|uniref:extracellular solute-binding protein n=1 Tax=Pseudonocardia sp. TaxID=60912 RepID=UPI0026147EDF|nr:extracellular solute-binding protein [Pseudonocardia sp.]
MLAALLRRRLLLVPAVVLVLVVVLGVVVVLSGGSGSAGGGSADAAPRAGAATEVDTAGIEYADRLVVYNGRSHYGDEQVFLDFEEATGVDIELRGGTAPELFERLEQEGADSPADLLVTTDLANLWRAEEAGLLQGVTSPTLQSQVPEGLHDADGSWWAVSTRLRIPVVSTERIPAGAVDGYEDLGDPAYRGRTCLRTSNSEYNQSMVADMIAKRGAEATEELLRSWMANEPQILGSDGEMLAVMAAGDCDLGLSNHYYLGRALDENPGFPVAPAWPDQDGAGAHTNLSGVGVVAGSDAVPTAVALMEWLTSPPAQEQIIARSEFAANPAVPPAPHIRDWADVRIDPIAVEEAGPLLDDAISLMLAVGWD